jgi:hypothetical protein
MQVFHELARIVVKTMKIIKLHKIHSMAMVCKTAFESTNDIVVKNKTPWTKSKLHIANAKKTKMATLFGKNNNVARNKHSKLNVLSKKQLAPSTSATVECVNKKRPSDESDKRKPRVLRSAKK